MCKTAQPKVGNIEQQDDQQDYSQDSGVESNRSQSQCSSQSSSGPSKQTAFIDTIPSLDQPTSSNNEMQFLGRFEDPDSDEDYMALKISKVV